MAPQPERRDVTPLPDLLHGRSRAGPARQQPQVPPQEGIAGFGEVLGGLSEREATYEARRRLSCGNRCECDGCLGEAYDGPSLIIAYSHCIAHGIEMRDGLGQRYRAVASGYRPLVRYDPTVRAAGGNPFLLNSLRPRIALADYTQRELRYRVLASTHPSEAERLGILAQEAVDQRWDTYEEMATRGAHQFPADARKDR